MFGVVGLLVAAYVVKRMFASVPAPAAPATRNVPMAIADIEPGTVITENHLGQGPYPVDKLERDTLLVNRVVVGRVAKVKIPAAQPIRANMLYKPGELPPLQVADGYRAITVDIGESTAMVDGMIKPGQYVDVLFTTGYESGGDALQGGVTLRLFEGVKVIAINRNFSQGRVERGGNRVTLELTEPQANVLVMARERGRITLTYNPQGPGDGGLALNNAERVTLYEILGMKPAEPPPEPFSTETYRGSSRTVFLFNDKGQRVEERPVAPSQPRMVLPTSPNTNSSPDDRPTGPTTDRVRIPVGPAPYDPMFPATPPTAIQPRAFH